MKFKLSKDCEKETTKLKMIVSAQKALTIVFNPHILRETKNMIK
jgi:hypothetical protein